MINLLLGAVASGLAGFRLAAFLVSEKGPGEIFKKLRQKIGIVHNDSGTPEEWPNTFAAQLFVCNRCMSVWTTSLMFLLFVCGLEIVVLLCAAWAVAAIVGEITGG